jgi:hypothetical protein
MRAAFVTWLIASLSVVSLLAMVLFSLAIVGYFEAPELSELSIDRVPLVLALAFLVAGHVVARRVPPARCLGKTRTFGTSLSYRTAPAVVDACADAAACARRAQAALHRRVAWGVALSTPIALISVRATQTHDSLGGYGCRSSPLYEGGNVLLFVALAAAAFVSHGATLVRSTSHDTRRA